MGFKGRPASGRYQSGTVQAKRQEMRCKLFIVASAIALAGCTNVGMDAAAGPLVGQNISVVVGKVGLPTNKGEFFGRTSYTWQTGNTYVGFCTVEFSVAQDNAIESWRWNGNQGACSAFASQLRTNIGNIGRES